MDNLYERTKALSSALKILESKGYPQDRIQTQSLTPRLEGLIPSPKHVFYDRDQRRFHIQFLYPTGYIYLIEDGTYQLFIDEEETSLRNQGIQPRRPLPGRVDQKRYTTHDGLW